MPPRCAPLELIPGVGHLAPMEDSGAFRSAAAAVPGVIVVIGAGVCGLAAAYELSRRGQRAVVLERAEPFAEQSAGLARIFRIAHRRPALCALALEARAGRRSSARLALKI